MLYQHILEAKLIDAENGVKALARQELEEIKEPQVLDKIQEWLSAEKDLASLLGTELNAGFTLFEYSMLCAKYCKDTQKNRERICEFFIDRFPAKTLETNRWGLQNTSLHLASFLDLHSVVEKLLEKLPLLARQRNELSYSPIDVARSDFTRSLFKKHSLGSKSNSSGPLKIKTYSIESLSDPGSELRKKLAKRIERNQEPHAEQSLVAMGDSTLERNFLEKIQKDDEKNSWKQKRAIPESWQSSETKPVEAVQNTTEKNTSSQWQEKRSLGDIFKSDSEDNNSADTLIPEQELLVEIAQAAEPSYSKPEDVEVIEKVSNDYILAEDNVNSSMKDVASIPKSSSTDALLIIPELQALQLNTLKFSEGTDDWFKEVLSSVPDVDFENKDQNRHSILQKKSAILPIKKVNEKKQRNVHFDSAWSGKLEKRIYVSLESPVSPSKKNDIGKLLVKVEDFEILANRTMTALVSGVSEFSFEIDFQISENRTKRHLINLNRSDNFRKNCGIEDQITIKSQNPMIIQLFLTLKKEKKNIRQKFMDSMTRKGFFKASKDSAEMEIISEYYCTLFIPNQQFIDTKKAGKIQQISQELKFKNVSDTGDSQLLDCTLNWKSCFIPYLEDLEEAFLPNCISECETAWLNRERFPPIEFTGDLIQKGGDCQEPTKKFFQLKDSAMTGFKTGSKNAVSIDISMLSSIQSGGVFVDFEELEFSEAVDLSELTINGAKSFMLTFKDDQDIEFQVENTELLVKWVSSIIQSKNRYLGNIIDPWIDVFEKCK